MKRTLPPAGRRTRRRRLQGRRAAPLVDAGTDIPVYLKAGETRTISFYKKNHVDGDDSVALTLKLKAIPQGL